MIEETIGDGVVNLDSAAGALPLDGGVQRWLQQEPECAWLDYAGQELCEEDCCLEGSSGDGCRDAMMETFSARAEGGFDRVIGSDEFGVMCGVGLQSQRCLLLL